MERPKPPIELKDYWETLTVQALGLYVLGFGLTSAKAEPKRAKLSRAEPVPGGLGHISQKAEGHKQAKAEGDEATRSKTLRHPGFPRDLSLGTDEAQW